MRYPVVVHKDIDSDYSVIVPDLPGCFSAGETFDEALNEAVEAIECHLEGLLPMPSDIEEHQTQPDYQGESGRW